MSVTTSAYIVFKTGSTTFAYNCATGEIEESSTDSGDIIQYAINAAPSGTVHIKGGTYIGGKVTGKTGITVEGEGRSTIYQLANGSNETTFDIAGDNFILKDMVLDGNKANQTGNGQVINISSHYNIKIMNCWIKNAKGWDCINMEYSNNVQVTGCEIQGADGFGVRLYHCYDILVEGNNIHDNQKINLTTDTSTRLRVVNNYSHDSIGEDGLAFDYNSTYCVVTGNVVYSNTHFGISVDAVLSPYFGGNTVSDNIVYDNGWDGINILRSSYNTVGHNFCQNNGQATHNWFSEIILHQETPLTGQPSKYNVVSGNTILMNGATRCKYGISEGDTECDYNLIAGNIVQGAATSNINKLGTNTILEHNIA